MGGRFGSVITAMVTPFRDDFSLDLDAARALIRDLVENGSAGRVVAGTAVATSGERTTVEQAVREAGAI